MPWLDSDVSCLLNTLFGGLTGMGADTMEASIEALTEGVRSLHPDYFVALVTFSNRLGKLKHIDI